MIDYEDLETKIIKGDKTKISFLQDDKIELRRGIQEGKHVIQIIIPWRNIYNLGRYDNEVSAKSDFDKYWDYLNKGYPIRITSYFDAEIIVPSK